MIPQQALIKVYDTADTIRVTFRFQGSAPEGYEFRIHANYSREPVETLVPARGGSELSVDLNPDNLSIYANYSFGLGPAGGVDVIRGPIRVLSVWGAGSMSSDQVFDIEPTVPANALLYLGEPLTYQSENITYTES